MPRRSGVPKRDVLPDPVYGSKVVTKVINQVMLDGKKGTAQEIVYNAFDLIKQKMGVEPIDAVGKEFDPNFHAAVMQEASEEFESGFVTKELQKGYKMGDKIIRPSTVVVAE